MLSPTADAMLAARPVNSLAFRVRWELVQPAAARHEPVSPMIRNPKVTPRQIHRLPADTDAVFGGAGSSGGPMLLRREMRACTRMTSTSAVVRRRAFGPERRRPPA